MNYWENRYATGGNSGEGSYGAFAEFKANVLNPFVFEHGITTVIEFGCGDGNQLSLMQYPTYLGLDIAPTAVRRCRELFADDATKSFSLYDKDHPNKVRAELALSLEVVFHLVDDGQYGRYMQDLFTAATRFVVIYSTNHIPDPCSAPHVRHRRFTDWVEKHQPNWKLLQHILNSVVSTESEFWIYGVK